MEGVRCVDKLLCLLEKYRCHLKRGDKSSAEFLRENFAEYVKDVKEALKPEDNPLGAPKVFDLNTITIRLELEDCLNGRDIKDDPFLWGLENAPNDWENV